MDINLTLTIIGIVLTIVLGIYGIYYTKSSIKNSDVSLICHSIIPIFSTLQKRFDNIKIEYSGNQISENLIYLKFTFVNNGKFDIDKEKIFKPLELEFPDNYKVLECKISEKSSDDIISNITINDNKTTIEWDLLKMNEYLSLELFLDLPKDDTGINASNITKKLKLNFRIADLRRINILDYKNNKPKKLTSMLFGSILGFFGMMFLGLILGGGLFFGIYSFVNPIVEIKENQKVFKETSEVIKKIEVLENSLILFKEDSKIINTIPIVGAEELIYLTPKIEVTKNNYFITIGFLAFFSLYIYGTYISIKEFIHQIKMNNIFSRLKK